MSAAQAASLRRAIADELDGNLLPFWRRRVILDDPAGGSPAGAFVNEMANDGSVRHDAPLALILASRLLWGYSALYRALGDERDLELARRAARQLHSRLWDDEHGGYLWRVDAAGRVVDGAKKTYGQAFAVYAWSELHLATGDAAARTLARRLFAALEGAARDAEHGGYIEALARDWTEADDLRLSDKDLDEAKSMNAHLHVLEAYTNLHRADPRAGAGPRIEELIDLFDRHILDREGRHLGHFFDRRWRPRSDGYSYGHDIEAAWLLGEAAAALGDAGRESVAARRAVLIADAVLAEGLDEDGAVAYAGRAGTVTDRNREWWCQAEAVVGFWHAFTVSGEKRFADAAARVWGFIAERVVDRRGGEWFWRVRPDGSADDALPKVSEWKGPYHNVRMCLEMMRRIDADVGG